MFGFFFRMEIFVFTGIRKLIVIEDGLMIRLSNVLSAEGRKECWRNEQVAVAG